MIRRYIRYHTYIRPRKTINHPSIHISSREHLFEHLFFLRLSTTAKPPLPAIYHHHHHQKSRIPSPSHQTLGFFSFITPNGQIQRPRSKVRRRGEGGKYWRIWRGRGGEGVGVGGKENPPLSTFLSYRIIPTPWPYQHQHKTKENNPYFKKGRGEERRTGYRDGKCFRERMCSHGFTHALPRINAGVSQQKILLDLHTYGPPHFYQVSELGFRGFEAGGGGRKTWFVFFFGGRNGRLSKETRYGFMEEKCRGG